MVFSVALATYNGAKFLDQQLASIAGQSRPPCELVVADDGSNDATLEIVDAFAREHPDLPVVVLRNGGRPLGVAKNFERALARCRGDLIALCDQDDVWDDRRLEVMASTFTEQPDVDVVCCDALCVDDELRPLGKTVWDMRGTNDPVLRARLSSGDGLHDALHWYFFTGMVMAVRRSMVDVVLPIPSGEWTLHDRWIGCMAVATGRLAFIPERLALYRTHDSQWSAPTATPWFDVPRTGRLATPTWLAEPLGVEAVRLAQVLLTRLADRGIEPPSQTQHYLEAVVRLAQLRRRIISGSARAPIAAGRFAVTGGYRAVHRSLRSLARDVWTWGTCAACPATKRRLGATLPQWWPR